MAVERLAHAGTWTGATLLAIAAAIAAGAAAEQGPPSTEKAATGQTAEAPAETPVAEEPQAAKDKEFRGRLPAYYGRVVDEEQRKKIYAIQRDYAPRIDFLKGQLAALIAERDEKVAGVLTPEQLKKVEQLKVEAKAKRDRAKASKKEPAATSTE